ncbi:O-antigen ligase family protein [Dongia sp.]|uniref:O-antigen ligase family protein n=1 Tax=Dongia sp. TaxID=1977262 RepID=UPI003752F713
MNTHRAGLIEGGFVIFSVAVFLGLSNLGRTTDPNGGPQHNPLNTGLYLVVLVGVGLLLWMRRREVIPLLASSKLIWIFMAWATASIVWSLDANLAVRRLILFYAPLLVALYAAARFDPSTTIKLSGWAYFWTIFVSAAVAILLPNIGVMKDSWEALKWANLAEGEKLGGDWSGILGHKNVLGFATLANTQVFAWRWYVERDKRWLFGPIILFGIFVAYKSHSATSALLIALTLGTYFFVHVLRKARRLRGLIFFAMFVVAAAVLVAALMLPDQFTALVGKDATLTGRVPIWIVVLDHVIPSRPIFGWGFNTYFIPANPDYLRLVGIVGWPAPHAHNGYLNLAVELGIPGAVLGTLILLRLIAGAVRRLDDDRAPWVLNVLVFAVTFAILNMVESSLLRISDNWEFALLFCCFVLWRHQALSRPKARPAARRWSAFKSNETKESK